MIAFVSHLFNFSRLLFSWMPPYLYQFTVSALTVASYVLVIVIAIKVISLGVDLISKLFV